jgi:3D (Asp-Asp-Asp) domain-containing protein
MPNVRTTAYTRVEKGGRRNALGAYLSGHHVMSAASDWSRFPLGTRFRIVNTREEFIIDDYGPALIGTSTIDLYKPTRLEMKRWGVRNVDIDILQWGFRGAESQSARPTRETSDRSTHDRRTSQKVPVFTHWGCFYFRAVFGPYLFGPHFGLINGAGHRFSRE